MGEVLRPDGTKVWRVRRTLAYDPVTRKTTVVAGEGKTPKEAYERLERNVLRREVLMGLKSPEELYSPLPAKLSTTVKEFLKEWAPKQDWSEQTRGAQLRRMALHINDGQGVGHIKLRMLTISDCQSFLDRLKAKKAKDGSQLLSGTAQRAVVLLLKGALDDAKDQQLILANPMDAIEVPQRNEVDKEHIKRVKSWLPLQVFKAIEGDELEALWALFFLGMRQSERLGLTDDRVFLDAKNPRIEIRQQLLRHTDGERGTNTLYIAQRTKSKKSRRDIQLVEPWLSIVRAHRRKQLARRKKFTPEHRELLAAQGFDKLLFTREDGTPIRHQIENAEWKALLKRARATEIVGHDARHITVSLLSSLGYDAATIMRITGWSSTAMMAVYDHQTAAITRAPLEELGKVLIARRGKTVDQLVEVAKQMDADEEEEDA
ncbi:Phage integrase family protein [Jatrophihabitans endophyticus]|uniref:Phage integrase family protein n=2 Tax=Jatrophihabitans endophyticus TaxID=1206085 RepID=A0A1M5HCX4_9ACTN|nr:Phage integrase family protein [Jatrophihabitans endophyticus]